MGIIIYCLPQGKILQLNTVRVLTVDLTAKAFLVSPLAKLLAVVVAWCVQFLIHKW